MEKIGIFENKVYINEFGTIHVLDKQTGKTVWKNSEYKGHASQFDFEYDENGFIILDDYSMISIATFSGIWETNPEDTQIAIDVDMHFVMDHYTKSSQVFGTWSHSGDRIELKCNNGKTYSGQLLVQKDEKSLVLKINIDGQDIVFYWTQPNAG